MIECETKLKKWGNSIGFIIPKEDINREDLHEDEVVRAVIAPKKMVKVKDIFGKISLKKSTAQIMKESDKELDSKFI